MKSTILFLIVLGLGFVSCDQSESGGSYKGDDYISFAKENLDSTIYSFAYDRLATQAFVKIEMDMVSGKKAYGRSFKIVFLPEESSATEGTHFIKTAEEQIVAADRCSATLEITVIKKPELENRTVTAVFELRPSSDFQIGFPARNRCRLIISDKLNRPLWWNNWHISSGLGTYSDRKYRFFIDEVHEYNLDYENRDDMDYYKMRSLVLQFKHWLQANPQTETDGSLMTVAIRG